MRLVTTLPVPSTCPMSAMTPASAPWHADRIGGRGGSPAGRSSGASAPLDTTVLGAYLREIRDDSLLTAEEERELAGAIARGDEEAKARLIRSNLRLVVKIARSYRGRGLALEDLIGEGNLGLIRAASGFDPSFGTRFSTYASHWIRESIRRALGSTTAPIRLPAYMVGLLTRWREAERALLRRDGVPPSHDQIADAVGLSGPRRTMVEQALQAGRFLAGGAPGEDDALLDVAAADPGGPGAEIEAEEQLRDLRRGLDRLDERERAVLTLCFGLDGQEPQNLSAIGRRLGVSREWVRQIVARAVRKLGEQDADDESPRAVAPRRRRPGRAAAGRPAVSPCEVN